MERTKNNNNNNNNNTKQIETLSIEAFRSEGFLMVNKKMIIVLGLYPAILLSNYIDKYEYFKRKNVENDGWFYVTHKQLINQLNIAMYTIKKHKAKLISFGILNVKYKGSPAKEWFRIDFVRLLNILDSGLPESDCLGPPETDRHITIPETKSLIYDESKISKNLVGSNFVIVPNIFETFWKLYPKHPDKGKAKTAWDKICKKPTKERPTWKEVRKALKLQKESERWQDIKFIPHPTTWLNQSRWLDDPEEMKSFNRETDNKPEKIMRVGEWQYLKSNGKYYNSEGRLWIE